MRCRGAAPAFESECREYESLVSGSEDLICTSAELNAAVVLLKTETASRDIGISGNCCGLPQKTPDHKIHA